MERKTIHIHKGKGNKDRISILADTTAKHIQEYVVQYRPKYWLFEGQNREQYIAESVWKIFDRLKKRCNIEKKGNGHLLRHTFATNLLEAGTDNLGTTNISKHGTNQQKSITLWQVYPIC